MLLRVSEVARELALEESTIRKWVFQRRLPVVRLGRSIRIKKTDVEELMKKGLRPAVAENSKR